MMAAPAKTTRTKAKVAAAKPSRGTTKASKPGAAAPRKPSAAPTPAPKPSKEELRALVEKQAATIAALRAKGRESNKAAKVSDGRIAELEAEVARLQRQAAAHNARIERDQSAPAKRSKQGPAKQGRGTKPASGQDVDPGDAVPPGVAVQQPEPLDAAAEAAKTALEENLASD